MNRPPWNHPERARRGARRARVEEEGVPFRRIAWVCLVLLAIGLVVAAPATAGVALASQPDPTTVVDRGLATTQGMIEVKPTSLDFGELAPGESANATVTIHNEGYDVLTVRGLSVEGDGAAAYGVAPSDGFELEEGASRDVTVTATATEEGPTNATLEIESSDQEYPTVAVSLAYTRGTLIEAENTTDERGTATTLTVRNASPDSSVTSWLEGRDDPDNFTVDRIWVNVTEATDFTLEVVASRDRIEDAPDFELDDGTLAVGYLRIDHSLPDELVDSADVRFRVSKVRLAAADADPTDVALYRYHDGSWDELETPLVNETATHYVFRAHSPRLSDFTSGVKQPKFDIAEAAVDVERVERGGSVTVLVDIRNDGGADGTFTTTLRLNGDVVSQRDVTIAPDNNRVVTFSRVLDEPGTYVVEVNDRRAGEVVVTADETATPVPDGTPADDDTPDPDERTDIDVPGFGLAAGLVAVLVVLSLALCGRRRP